MNKFSCTFLLSLIAVFHQTEPSNLSRIYGGNKAKIGFAPYQISLQSQDLGHYCGGAIIAESFILTAAHCIEDLEPKDYVVVTGTSEWQKPGAKYQVDKVIMHSNYIPGEVHDDIAVLHLKTKIVWNETTKPIKLAGKPMSAAGRVAVLTGWGHTKTFDSSVNELMQVHLRLISNGECVAGLREYQEHLTPGNICTSTKHGEGGCKGDSGGPLVTEDRRYLIGLVSFGVPCAIGYPDVYTSIAYNRKWITNAMQELRGN